jgi:hypothetical protein
VAIDEEGPIDFWGLVSGRGHRAYVASDTLWRAIFGTCHSSRVRSAERPSPGRCRAPQPDPPFLGMPGGRCSGRACPGSKRVFLRHRSCLPKILDKGGTAHNGAVARASTTRCHQPGDHSIASADSPLSSAVARRTPGPQGPPVRNTTSLRSGYRRRLLACRDN